MGYARTAICSRSGENFGKFEKKLEGLEMGRIHATISHDGGFSIAVVVLEKKLGI